MTLEVVIDLDRDDGMDTPDALELPFDYVAVREVTAVRSEALDIELAQLHPFVQEIDDLDPDDLLRGAVTTALAGLAPPNDEEDT